MNEAFGEHFRVELLEHVFVFDVFEHDHHLIQRVLQFSLAIERKTAYKWGREGWGWGREGCATEIVGEKSPLRGF